MEGKTHLVVAGGGSIEIHDGKPHAKAAVAEYLADLAAISGMQVHWFASESRGNILHTPLAEELVTAHVWEHSPVRAPSLLQRLRSLIVDLRRVRKLLASAAGAIVFDPAPMGLSAFLVGPWSKRSLLYFPSSPSAVWWYQLTARPSLGRAARFVYFTLSSHLAALAASGVLVRDASQLNRLGRLGFRRLELSKPIICAGHETAATRTHPGRPLRLLFVGVFAPRKGLDVLFEAVALARKRCENPQDIQLTLIGGGRAGGVEQWSTDEVAAMATAAGLDPASVEFTGYLSDPEELQRRYRAAGALIHPSFQEGFPRVIDEAMLNGLPVIAAAIPQISQVLRAGEDALLATPKSAESLADCIFRLLDDSTLYDRLARGAAARESVLRGESAAQQHLRLLSGSATD